MESPNLLKEFGIRVAEYRKQRKLSQAQLAAKAGITQGMVSNIENGKGEDLSFTTIRGLSKALDVKPAVLIGEEAAPVIRTDPELEQFKKDALSALIHASDAEWHAVRPSLNALLPAVKQKKATS